MSVAYLRDLLLEQHILMRQTWYNQPSFELNKASIDATMERLTVVECNQAYRDAALIIYEWNL